MKFADLFKPVPLRTVRIVEIPTFKAQEQNRYLGKENESRSSKSGFALSALSAPLVPLDEPFVEGQRYRLAGAVEWPSRLDLYHVDPGGPWLRRHDVLIAISEG
jgi:hypothetical protein